MKRSILLHALLICILSFALITSCQGSSSSSMGTPVASFASYPSSVLGVVIDPAGKVLYVEPGSAAEQAGISRNDLLQKVNNLSVNSARQQVRSAVQAAKPGQSLIVMLQRNGNEFILNVKPSPPASRSGMVTATPVPTSDDYL
jgi:S1-C subfamily serine protease